jgi:hypothetical protein
MENPVLNEKIHNPSNLRLSYAVLHYAPEGLFKTDTFENPKDALSCYVSIPEEFNPKLKCIINANLKNTYYSCLAPIRLISLQEIVDAGGEIPRHIEEIALKAIAKSIRENLPFNSYAHGFII